MSWRSLVLNKRIVFSLVFRGFFCFHQVFCNRVGNQSTSYWRNKTTRTRNISTISAFSFCVWRTDTMVKTGIFCFFVIWPSERLGRGDDFQGSDSSFFMRILLTFFKIISIEKNTVKNYFILSEKCAESTITCLRLEWCQKGDSLYEFFKNI